MRRLLAISSVVLLACLPAMTGTDSFAARDSEGWIQLKEDLYINENSLARPSGQLVSLWVKIVPAPGSELLTEARGQLMARGRNDQALAYDYTGFLAEIDCSRHLHRELVTILYDVNKNILHATDNVPASWSAISQGSSFHLVQVSVCTKVNDEYAHEPGDEGRGC